jgi:biofilm PGA synthesis N-glycosyltransferase PgaC
LTPFVLEDFVFAIIAVFSGFYVFYYLICLQYVRKGGTSEDSSLNPDSLPSVSFIVPTYNENRIISERIGNFREMNYPEERLEVVFVDGGSEDGTLEKIRSLAKDLPFQVKIIEQGSRKGFNMAVIEGFLSTVGEIIFITGAETQYDPDAVRIIVRHFADPGIGAVNGTMRVSNPAKGLSTRLETAYRGLYDFIRQAESNMDSPFDIKGEIAASRRTVCQHLVENTEMLKKGCIDACVSFQAKKDGYRTVYEPRAVYHEPAPETMQDSLKQQSRRAATLIQNMLIFKSMIFKRKYGLFGMLIMPAHLLMLLIMPFLFLISVVSFLVLVALSLFNYYILGLLIIALVVLLCSKRAQAFAKTQLVLVFTCMKMLKRVETQKFERLSSVRPQN